MAPDKAKKLKELLSLVNEGLSREEFVASFKTVLEQITALEKKLIEKINTKQQQSDSAIEDGLASLEPLKAQFRQAIREAKEANETTFAAVRQRAVEGISGLFNKMRLNEKFNSMMDEMMAEHKKKMEGMDTMIAEIPSKDEFKAMIPEEITPVQVRDKLESIKEEEEKLKIAAIAHLQEELDKLKALIGKGTGGGGGLSRMALQMALAKLIKHQNFSTSSATTTLTLNDKAAGDVALWLRYNGQVLEHGTHYTVSGTIITLLFTPDDDTKMTVTYIAG